MKIQKIPQMKNVSLAIVMMTGFGGCADLTLDQVVDVLGRRPPSQGQGTQAPPPQGTPTSTAPSPQAPPPPTAQTPPVGTPQSPPMTAAMDELLGTWMNRDANTNGMTKLVVTKINDQTLGLHGFGKCSPSDCDWGAINTALSQPWTVGVYQFGFKQTRISFRRIGDELQVQTSDHYTDRSGRQDRNDQYTFVRTPAMHVRPGIFSAPRGFSPQ